MCKIGYYIGILTRCIADSFEKYQQPIINNKKTDESAMEKFQEKIPADILSNLKMIADEIEYNKQWQWKFIYNVMVIYGLIVWIYERVKHPEELAFKVILIFLIAITMITGIYLVNRVQCKLKEYRDTAEKFQKLLPDYFKMDKKGEGLNFNVYAIIVILIGGVITICLVSGQVLK